MAMQQHKLVCGRPRPQNHRFGTTFALEKQKLQLLCSWWVGICVPVFSEHTLNAFRERKSSDDAADEERRCISQSHALDFLWMA